MSSDRDAPIEMASTLLADFEERTGVVGREPGTRYLWTDAFAVCTYLSIARATGEARPLAHAERLVERVHHVLGRHRPDDVRRGWLSGLGDAEGESHPTLGGLRIGKTLPERRPDEPYDDALEWERDGQYFHYLAKWMHALDQLARETGEPRHARAAVELAVVAHRAFVTRRPGARAPRLIWKASLDLARPLVASMGQHDPLDGLVTSLQLRATARRLDVGGDALEPAIDDYAAIVATSDLATTDPLGLGGLLADAYRLAQLGEVPLLAAGGLLDRVLDAALDGLELYVGGGEPSGPASHRLGFRELGLAIGLPAIERFASELERDTLAGCDARRLRPPLAELARHAALGEAITAFWLRPESRRVRTWLEHHDIDEVMLATALAPEGFLVLGAR